MNDYFNPRLPYCAIQSDSGNCPEVIAWGVNIDGNEFFLCEKCYDNVVIKGVYGEQKVLAAVKISSIFVDRMRKN